MSVPSRSRRRFVADATLCLGALVAGSGAEAFQRRAKDPPGSTLPLLPRVNGGLNVQPVRRLDEISDFTPPVIFPELVHLQMRPVYELGFESLRTTISFNGFGPDFLAAIPYVRAARALGVDVLGIIGQFGHGFDLARALADPRRRDIVLQTYVDIFAAPVAPASSGLRQTGSIAFQLLNEPTQFLGIAPAEYVRLLLAPCAEVLRRIAPEATVVAAATAGRRLGVRRYREAVAAGLEDHCDVAAVHVYDLDLLDELAPLVRVPTWVTESGARGVGSHLAWFETGFGSIRERLTTVDRIYWFHLFDRQPDAFRLIELNEPTPGSFTARIESTDLVGYLAARVAEAAGEQEHARYDALIPDMGPYLPTLADLALIDAARRRLAAAG